MNIFITKIQYLIIYTISQYKWRKSCQIEPQILYDEGLMNFNNTNYIIPGINPFHPITQENQINGYVINVNNGGIILYIIYFISTW